MPSGFTWGVYVDDNDTPWSLRVNDTYFGHAERGWSSAEGSGITPFPRQWKPRKVLGIDSLGRAQTAVSPTTGTLLWTGGSSSFAVLGNDGSLLLCTVIGRLAEDRRATPL